MLVGPEGFATPKRPETGSEEIFILGIDLILLLKMTVSRVDKQEPKYVSG
jgi:hypothetical protein